MSDITTAFWGMTINNYDETTLALVQQGYPDFIRQLVYTCEVGEQGTPHIQAYMKLYRQQRLSYVKKLFPRGNFKALTNDEYKLNAQRYAQKLDKTADSPAVINNNPFPDPVVELTSVVEDAFDNFGEKPWYDTKEKDFFWYASQVEKLRVVEKPSLAKFYVSATYKNIKKEFWRSIAEHVFTRQKSEHTHTHTHSEEIFSREGGIEDADDDTQENSEELGEEGNEGEDDEDDSGETASDDATSIGSGDSETDASTQYSE